MKIKRIEFAHEITDPHMDNLDVFVENEDGYTYTIVVSTPGDLLDQMEQEKINFIMPDTPKIIVKKLTEQIVREAMVGKKMPASSVIVKCLEQAINNQSV